MLIGVHGLFGIVGAFSSQFILWWGIIVLAVGMFDIAYKKNLNGQAAKWAAYAAGIEVLLRMRDAYVTYELMKYAVIGFLVLGMIVERPFRRSPVVFVFLFLLLLPSLVITELPEDRFRQSILFNLSGPVVLLVTSYYFYDRPLTWREVRGIFLFYVLPIISTAIVLQLISPDLTQIQYTAESNFETSGGFGPNQVSTVLAFGVFVFLVALLLQGGLTGFWLLDLLTVLFLAFRAVITFSRGGILSILASFLVLITLGVYFKQPFVRRFSSYAVVVVPIFIWGWLYVVDLTGGQIRHRYLGLSARGEEVSSISSGRTNIFESDIQMFLENPITGVGVGASSYLREKRLGYFAASHSEFGRLISEHGLFGILFLCTLIFLVLNRFFSRSLPRLTRIWCLVVFTFATLTINHSALRIALPGFVFGLIFVTLVTTNPVTRLRS